MKLLKNYIEKQKKKSLWAKITDILFILLIIGLLIPQSRTPIMIFIKQITNFAPSVSAKDSFGKLNKTDYEWKFLDSGQKTKSLNDFNDKPILINFWATWCPPCIAEMPSLQKLQNEYDSKIHFIFISHESPSITLPFLREKKWSFSSYTPLLQEPELLQSNSLPTTFIIGKAGNIVVKKTGNHKWDSDGVKELLDQLIDE